MYLSERQVHHGFYYHHQAAHPQQDCVVELAEYAGQQALTIHCTQLGEQYSAKDRQRIPAEWVAFLREHPQAFTRLSFCSRMTQELLDAVCCQRNLVELEIKWGAYRDLAALENLQNLKLLYIGSGAGVESIAPLGRLAWLKGLYVENFRKIADYSALGQLQELESLTLCGDCLGPQYIRVDSLEFLRTLQQLRFFSFRTARLTTADYSPILALHGLEHLSLDDNRQVRAWHAELISLPLLRWGTVIEQSGRH